MTSLVIKYKISFHIILSYIFVRCESDTTCSLSSIFDYDLRKMEKQTNKQTNSPVKSNLPCRPIVKPGLARPQSAEWWRYVRQCPVMLVTLREGYLNKWSRITCCSRRKPLINTTHTANARPVVGQVRFIVMLYLCTRLT